MATALVTGGAAGIGLATARMLRERGHDVLVADVAPPPDDLDATFAERDVRSADDWRALADAGPFDLAFLNAGVASRTSDFLASDLDEIDRVLRIDVDGVVLGTRFVAPGMAERGGGAIAATASLAGLTPLDLDPVYTAAKHAVVGFVRAAAGPLGRQGIRINAICPGFTDTAILQHAGDVGKLATEGYELMAPEQIAAAALETFDGDETGQALVCQAGRDVPLRYAFRGIPGPHRT